LWLMSMIPFYGSINYLRPLDLTVDPESIPRYGTIGGIEVTSSWARLAPLFLMLPLWIAAAGRARKEDSRNKDNALNTLFATRPMSSTALVVAKWTMSARSALVTWLALVPFVLIWLMTPAMDRGVEGLLLAGLDRGTPGPLGLLILKYLTPMIIARVVVVSAGLIYLTWKFQADSVFAWSSGRPWIIWTYATLLTIAIVASVEVIGVGFAVDFNESIGLGTALPPSIHQPSFSHVEIRNFLLMHVLPAAIAVAAALKLVAMAAIAPVLPRRGLVARPALGRIVVGWFAATVVVAVVAVILTPVKLAAPWLVVATVVLLMPGARIAIAPIMLDSNRHR
jgi:hypothetical protein